MPVPLRVVSYNVRSLRDDPAAVAAVLRELRPDVACIQEAPRFWRWRAACARLAADAGLAVLTGGRPAAANLLLGGPRVRLLARADVRFPWRPPRHRRGMAFAEVEIDGVRLAVAAAHLSLDPAERLAHSERILARLAGAGAPAVLGADVNDVPGSLAWAALTATLRDAGEPARAGRALTFPAHAPDRRIDAVFVGAGLRVVRCGVPADLVATARASDHLPVVAVLDVVAALDLSVRPESWPL